MHDGAVVQTGHARGAVRAAGAHLRRLFHRLAGHERAAAAGSRARRPMSTASASPLAARPTRRCPGASASSSASGRNSCALQPNGRGLPARSTRSTISAAADRPASSWAARPSRPSVPEDVAVAGDEAALALRPRQDPHLRGRPPRAGEGGRAHGQARQQPRLVPGAAGLRHRRLLAPILPLMTVVNYSVQDTFGNNQFFWNGVGWFQDLLDPSNELGGRFFDALWRNLLFSAIILAIEIPLGIAVALAMPREGWRVAALPRPDGAAAADPVERRRHDLADLRARRYRPARLDGQRARASTTTTRPRSPRCLDHHHRHGCLALDEPRGAALLCGPASRSPTPITRRPDRRRVALGGVPLHPAAEDAAAFC